MFQVVTPRVQALVNYQDIVVGVYSALVCEKGKISGFNLPPENNSIRTNYSDAIGVKPLIKLFASINNAFPEYELNIENLLTKGEKVMAKYTVRGIQKGNFMGMAPTGCSMKVTGLDIFRLYQGKVVEYWNAKHQIEAIK